MRTDSKMHRCPHCGKRTFENKEWFNNKYWYRLTDSSGKHRIMICPSCNKASRFKVVNNPYIWIVLPFDIGFIILVSWMYETFDKLSMLAVFPLVVIVAAAHTILSRIKKPFLPCDLDTREFLHIQPDATVTVNSSKYIKPYGVYGLKFKQGEADAKYREAFSDGLVPAVFYPNEKGSLTYDVRIINKSAVPQDMLFDGAKFLVEDTDGIFIAKGTVERSQLDI